MSVTAKVSVTGHTITVLVHNCLKINQLSGHWDYFGWDKKDQLSGIGFFQLENVKFGIIVESRSSDSLAIVDFLQFF